MPRRVLPLSGMDGTSIGLPGADAAAGLFGPLAGATSAAEGDEWVKTRISLSLTCTKVSIRSINFWMSLPSSAIWEVVGEDASRANFWAAPHLVSSYKYTRLQPGGRPVSPGFSASRCLGLHPPWWPQAACRPGGRGQGLAVMTPGAKTSTRVEICGLACSPRWGWDGTVYPNPLGYPKAELLP